MPLSNNPYDRHCNQVHVNLLQAVPDGIFLDYVIQGFRSENEQEACSMMMERLALSRPPETTIITCDRGYESYYLMMKASSLGMKFCFRFKDASSAGGISMRYACHIDDTGCFDIDVKRKYTRTYNITKDRFVGHEYIYLSQDHENPFVPKPANRKGRPHNGEEMKVAFYEYEFRLVRFKLTDNTYEVLATNLSRQEFPVDKLKALYHMRWGIESGIRHLKYDDNLQFFHTKKKTAAIGEMILAMVFHNICALSIIILSPRIDKELRERSRVYLYKASYSDMAASIRIIILQRGSPGTIKNLVRELIATMQPVRCDRAYERHISDKYFRPFIFRVA